MMLKTMEIIPSLSKTVLYTKTLLVISAVDAALPAHWDDMKGDLLKLFPVTAGSKEYNDVEKKFTKTGLSATIISVCSLTDHLNCLLITDNYVIR